MKTHLLLSKSWLFILVVCPIEGNEEFSEGIEVYDEGIEDYNEAVEYLNVEESGHATKEFSLRRIDNSDLDLSYDTVVRLASLPLTCYSVEYPNKLNQVLAEEQDLLSPSELHPIFYGCFDWHSSVHGHWLLARASSLFPSTELAENVTKVFSAQFSPEKVEAEIKYFTTQFGSSWERTYGWAWLLKLQEELIRLDAITESRWGEILEPLSTKIATLMKDFLPRLVYPIRVGEHTNTAFGLSLSLDFARMAEGAKVEELEGLKELESLIVANSTQFYHTDRLCPIGYEPSGFDFLSPCLQEADLMTRVLEDPIQFRDWLQLFLPQLLDPDFQLQPGEVVDRTDGKLVHLDGVNFSRAWALYTIAAKLVQISPEDEMTAIRLLELGDTHVLASRDNVVGSNYAGSHWLATFLMYALERRQQLTELL